MSPATSPIPCSPTIATTSAPTSIARRDRQLRVGGRELGRLPGRRRAGHAERNREAVRRGGQRWWRRRTPTPMAAICSTTCRPGTYYVDVRDGTGSQPYTLPVPGMTQTPPSDAGRMPTSATRTTARRRSRRRRLTGYQVVLPCGRREPDGGLRLQLQPGGVRERRSGLHRTPPRRRSATGCGSMRTATARRIRRKSASPACLVTLYYDPDRDGIFGTGDDMPGGDGHDRRQRQLPVRQPAARRVCGESDRPPPAGYTQTGDPDTSGRAAATTTTRRRRRWCWRPATCS